MAIRLPRTLTALCLVLASTVSGLVVTADPAAAQRAITIEGGGWGHGVGMSQFGAKGQADAGRRFTQILQHYYPGVSIGQFSPTRWNDVRVLLDQADVTYRIEPRGSMTLHYPGGKRDVGSADVVTIGGNKSSSWVKVNGQDVPGLPFSAPARPYVQLKGNRAVLSHDGGAVIGEYRHGNLEISTGVPGCGANQCAVVRNMTMDQYLYGLAEMPSSWHIEALMAQAVAGRSFADLKVGGSSSRLFDLLRTTQDQVYAGWAKEGEPTFGTRWKEAVDDSTGRVIRSGGQTVSANYHSTSGGQTESSAYVWGGSHSHLRSVSDPWDSGSPRHRWSRSYTLEEIGAWFGVSDVRDVRIGGNIGPSGRVDRATVRITGSSIREVTGNQFRQTINSRVPDDRALWSTKFRIVGVGGFPDVPPGAYYAPGVQWLAEKGITDGVGNTGLYMPDTVVTRAQMVTFLWRMMGSPGGSPAHGFPDVPASAYFEEPVRWARVNGVTDGVGNTGLFKPDDVVTRDQMATFLHRVAGLKAPGSRHPFPDVPGNTFYDQAVSWAFEHRITDGVGNTGLYMPRDPVTRAQMAAFMHRLASRAAAWDGPLPPTAP